jgi:hypothetical protein
LPTPTCAACLQPLNGRGNFVIVGTEVVHKECARQGRETRGARLLRELAASELREQHASRAADSALRVGDGAVARIQSMEATLRRTSSSLAIALGERDQAQQALATARAELDALRRVPALTPASTPAPEISVTPDAETVRDDTEVRFSLLELDPL